MLSNMIVKTVRMMIKLKVLLSRWFYCISTSFRVNAMSTEKRQIANDEYKILPKHDKKITFSNIIPFYFRDCFVQMQRVVRWPAWWRPPPPPPRTSPWPLPSLTSPPPRPLPIWPSCQSKASSFHPTTILISAGKHSYLILQLRLSISSTIIPNR